MKTVLTIKEIYEILSEQKPVSLRSVERRAQSEGWLYLEGKGRGKNGIVRKYMVIRLPVDVRNVIAVFFKKAKEVVKVEPQITAPVKGKKPVKKVLRVQKEKAYLKTELAKAYVKSIDSAKYGQKAKAKKIFFMSYNLGEAGTFPDIYREVGETNEKTLSAWKTKLENNNWDPECLVDNRGYYLKGKREVTKQQAEVILTLVRSQYNTPGKPKLELIRQCVAVMREKDIETNLSETTYLRWLKEWIEYNYDQWVFWRHGEKGLNDKVIPPLSRDYDKLEVGDILVADGHVLNFEMINPYTGKPKRMMLVAFSDFKTGFICGWEIMPTENIDSISVALRRSILRLGKMPKCVYMDNGRAFKATYFTGVKNFNQTKLPGLYRKLGIAVMTAKPYHGQAKPIERFFRTFGELERMSPTFVGECINNKPVWKNRGEKLHRLLHERTTRGFTPTLEDSHIVIGKWLDMWCRRKQGPESKLAGKTPLEIFEKGVGTGVNPLELRALMLVEETRKIKRRGIRLFKKWYNHKYLYGRTHKAIVYYDLQNRDSILVYDAKDEQFICEAVKQIGVHPAANILGTEAEQAELERQLESQESLKKQTVASTREIVKKQYIPEIRKRVQDSGFDINGNQEVKQIPEKKKELTKDDIEKIKSEVKALEKMQDDGEVIEIDDYEPTCEPEDINSEIDKMSDTDKYEKLIEMDSLGVPLTDEYKAFIIYFEKTSEYKDNKKYFEERRCDLITINQIKSG
ncbi:MAG: hypothetical protein GY714_10615 [Desulfobacterales bacterium]|nr:hypothetical protein [Desulfobacterales bacterium]